MSDLISRQAAIDALEKEKPTPFVNKDGSIDPFREGRQKQWHRDGLAILFLPSAQPTHDDGSNALDALDCVAQRKGKIIIRSTNMFDGEDCYCSECDHWALMPDYKFCPYCGIAFEDVITEGGDDATD